MSSILNFTLKCVISVLFSVLKRFREVPNLANFSRSNWADNINGSQIPLRNYKFFQQHFLA